MCMFCKCDTLKESKTTHVVNYKGCVIVIKNVPCMECEQCKKLSQCAQATGLFHAHMVFKTGKKYY